MSAYNNAEVLAKFTSVVEDDGLFVDLDEVIRWKLHHPQPYSPDVYQGLYTDPHGTIEEPYVMRIHELAAHGLDEGRSPRIRRRDGRPAPAAPELGRDPVRDRAARAPAAARRRRRSAPRCASARTRAKPLFLDIPLFVSDMSFGALSQEAKTALARGAQLAGTGICSGEGGMLPEEQAENSRYFYELASARFGWTWDVADEGAGVPLQARPGREDRHRRPPARARR